MSESEGPETGRSTLLDAVRRGQKKAAEAIRDRDRLPRARDSSTRDRIEKTGIKCRIPGCEGEVVKETLQKLVAGTTWRAGVAIPTYSEDSLFCWLCGVFYHHLPGSMLEPVGEECICTQVCDCANPEPQEGEAGAKSEECPVHNHDPRPNRECRAEQHFKRP